MLPADFARLAPRRMGRPASGVQDQLVALDVWDDGRTDAGRPELPPRQEVYQ